MDSLKFMPSFLRRLALLLCLFSLAAAQTTPVHPRWSEQKANDWYKLQPWLVGSNFIPKDAINELEMWQADTFNPPEIDRELGWAEAIGMNTMRVFLHDLLWQQDRAGFTSRINTFLDIAAKHHIRPIFVLFDSCWDPAPKLGPQHPPIPGVHNSGWVQSPGAKALADPSQYPRLRDYVTGVIGTFARDRRVLAWDLWNEPDNANEPAYIQLEPKKKIELVDALLPRVFAWAREVDPTQPLTSGVWHGDWSGKDQLPTTRIQISESDVLSFHDYGWPEDFEARVHELEQYHRAMICTEYMARGAGSTFDTILPLAKQLNVGAVNWGLVVGKTQTNLPWDSWVHPYVLSQPTIWFHEVFYGDGKPYREREVELIQQLTGRGSGYQK